MAKVYISCHHRDPANELAGQLEAAGHRVVSTWHRETEPRPAAEDAHAWSEKAIRNFDAINDEASALVLVAGPDRYPGGKFVEAGFAIGCGVDVVVLGRVENVMLNHPDVTHATGIAELLAVLK